MFLFKNKNLVGIDVGSSSVKLVQLKECKGGYELVKIGMAPLPAEAIVDKAHMDSAAIVAAIRSLIKTLDVKVQQAASSVSGNSVIIRKISYPVMTADELDEQINWEAEQYIPFDINDVNIGFHILGSGEAEPENMDVILVAAKKDIINDYLTLFKEAGMTLVVLDVDAFALQNVFEANYNPTPEEVIALANIGDAVTNLNIVRNGVTLFTRDIQLGGSQYTHEIQKKLTMKLDEAEKLKVSDAGANDETVLAVILQVNETLSMELFRSINFYVANNSEDRITKLYVSGGCSKTPFLLDTIQKRLGVPVENINPFQKIIYSDKQFAPGYLKNLAPHITVAVGLAMRRHGDK